MSDTTMSWDVLTMAELKAVLSEAQIPFSSSDVRWKSQLIRLCEANLRHDDLIRALVRCRKLPSGSCGPSLAEHKSLEQGEGSEPRVGRNSLPSSSAASSSSRQRSRSNKRHPPKSSGAVVRAAGRFSVPSSDDGPAARRKTVTKLTAQFSPPPTTSPSARADSVTPPSPGFPSASSFPTVDPKGELIRWKLRVPLARTSSPAHSQQPTPQERASIRTSQQQQQFTHSVGVEENSQPRKEMRPSTFPPSSQHQKQRVHPSQRITSRYRWSRIGSVSVVLVAATIFLFSHYRPDWSVQLKAKELLKAVHRLYWGRRFCDSSCVTDDGDHCHDCIPCPDNAICESGQMRCAQPQFRMEWRRGNVACVKDSETYRLAYHLFGVMSEVLQQQNGLLACNQRQKLHPEAVVVSLSAGTQFVGLTRCSLVTILSSQLQGRQVNGHHAVHLLFEELVRVLSNQERYGVRSTPLVLTREDNIFPRVPSECRDENQVRQATLFYSIFTKKTSRCKALEFATLHWWKVVASILAVTIPVLKLRRWRFHRAAKEAVCQVIVDLSSIKHHPSSSRQGYAIGPNADAILNALQSHRRKWFQWGEGQTEKAEVGKYAKYRWVGKHLTKHYIEAVCDRLVQSDPTFCRGVMVADMSPFFYSKSVIDRVRFSSSNQQPPVDETTPKN